MDTERVLAALREKANDVALASRISEASARFSLLNRGQNVNESGPVIATLCKKAASPPTIVRSNSFSETSTATISSDFDALSVRATAGSGSGSKFSDEALTIDSLVDAICSDAHLLEILRNVVKSGDANRSNQNSSSDLGTDFAAVLSAIKYCNTAPANCHRTVSNTLQPATRKRGKDKGSHQHSTTKNDVDKSKDIAEAPLASPNSARHSFSRETAKAGDCKTYICHDDHSSDEALRSFGWRKTLDEKSGRPYYYTDDHSQVTWENPLVGR